ncbi:MAG: ATP-binding cassette domain-containing protein [Bacteroidia bacterium]|nr:ATP-binding cassette domain-containing protein [Bacteroidia bacterium]
MSEKGLHILIRLFAVIGKAGNEENPVVCKTFLEVLLSYFFSESTVQEQLLVFEQQLNELSKQTGIIFNEPEIQSVFSLCRELNKELNMDQKIMIVQYLIELNALLKKMGLSDSILQIAETFNIRKQEFENYQSFSGERLYEISDKKNILIISGAEGSGSSGIRYLHKTNLNGQILIFKPQQTDSFFIRVKGETKLEINSRVLYAGLTYFFSRGSSITGTEISPVHYSEIEKLFVNIDPDLSIEFSAENIEYHFQSNHRGIYPFSLTATSGQMVAIIGGSGTGKTTLLKMLNGSLKPSSGRILLNGVDLHKNKKAMKGIIGYVPQEYILYDELTVYQNLFYSSRLCFGAQDLRSVQQKVIKTLHQFGLYEIRNLKVGTLLNKTISGGQIKRLNMAMELIREPQVLFVDEPTSGLSSSDSLKIIEILKEQSLSGKLVFINIHQPFSDIFKLFDKLLILDTGGFPVYWGDPADAIPYFKRHLELAEANINQCLHCGTINPEEIFYLIEKKITDHEGNETGKREVLPEQWYSIFSDNPANKSVSSAKNNTITNRSEPLSSKARQFIIYSKRNLISKLADKQYVFISIFEAPVLALVLGMLMRQSDFITRHYIFSKNENIPSYLFICVIVALFFGLIVSSDEIIKERKILKRESFTGLDYRQFFHAKIIYLFALSFLQVLLFVAVGNCILEIKGMTFSYCIVLWSVACFANLLGLNISNSLNSITAIYICIPFLLIPQILLSGIVVHFDKLHYRLAGQENVPLIGDVMASRWAFEALAVTQFKNNGYQKLFYSSDQNISNSAWITTFHLPLLAELNNNIWAVPEDSLYKTNPDRKKDINLLVKELQKYKSLFKKFCFNVRICADMNYSNETAEKTELFLKSLQLYYSKQLDQLLADKDSYINRLSKSKTNDYLIQLKNNYHNEKLAELVLNNNEYNKSLIFENRIIRKYQPVYAIPESPWGKAQFYAPVKKIGNTYIDTFWFNVCIIWIMTLLLYLILISDLLQKSKNCVKKIINTGSINLILRTFFS